MKITRNDTRCNIRCNYGGIRFTSSPFLTFTPVPITLQTIGVLLAGGILGARLGAISQIVFLLLVATGLPLLSGGRGGIGVFVGPSAGYLLSYPLTHFALGTFNPVSKN